MLKLLFFLSGVTFILGQLLTESFFFCHLTIFASGRYEYIFIPWKDEKILDQWNSKQDHKLGLAE